MSLLLFCSSHERRLARSLSVFPGIQLPASLLAPFGCSVWSAFPFAHLPAACGAPSSIALFLSMNAAVNRCSLFAVSFQGGVHSAAMRLRPWSPLRFINDNIGGVLCGLPAVVAVR